MARTRLSSEERIKSIKAKHKRHDQKRRELRKQQYQQNKERLKKRYQQNKYQLKRKYEEKKKQKELAERLKHIKLEKPWLEGNETVGVCSLPKEENSKILRTTHPLNPPPGGMEETVEQSSRKRRALLLRERVTVIEMYSTRPRPNYETLAKMFNCGRSQIKNILRQKGEILQAYERNPDSDRVRRTVPAILLALNQIVDEWLKRALSHNVRINDKAILQKSINVQKFLDYEDFEPTKTWLRSFKRRHGYYRVDLDTLKVPKDKMKSLKLRDIFEDIKDSIDPAITGAIELKLSSEKNCHGNSNSEQDEDTDLKDVDNSNWDISSDEFPSSECNETVVIKDNSQALEYLKPLEEFAMLTDNFRAIGLISQLEAIFRSKIRVTEDL